VEGRQAGQVARALLWRDSARAGVVRLGVVVETVFAVQQGGAEAGAVGGGHVPVGRRIATPT
jgi:hypothetical protein